MFNPNLKAVFILIINKQKNINLKVCSANGENSVKRLRLDAEAPSQEIQTLTVVKTGAKKSLKLQPLCASAETTTASPHPQPITSVFSKLFNASKKTATVSATTATMEKTENPVHVNSNKENEKDIPVVTIDD